MILETGMVTRPGETALDLESRTMIRFDLPKIKTLLPGLKPSCFEMLTRIMANFLMHHHKPTAAQMAGSVATHKRHPANVARFLQRSALQNGHLLARTARRVLAREGQRRGRWLLILDQTYVGHQGEHLENTFRRGNTRPRAKHSQRRQLTTARHSCHAFVVGLIITPSGARVPLMRSYYTPEYAHAKGLVHRTQADLAAELIRTAPLPGGVQALVLGDTAYDAVQVRQACAARSWHWIVPVNPERVLKEPKPRRKLTELAADLQASDWSPVRFAACGGDWKHHQRASACRESMKHQRVYYAHRERQHVLNVGSVLLVFSLKQKPTDHTRTADKILMTSDVKLSAKGVLEAYALRWQVELLFRELKSTLGLADYNFRQYSKVDGWVNACLLTFLLLEWQRHEALRKRKLTKLQRAWWQRQRTHGLCCALRQQIELRDLQHIQQALETPRGLARLRAQLRNLQPREYQPR
jgi:hypothetical protein